MPAGTLRTRTRLIESRQNPRVKELRAALSRSGRTPSGLIAIEGEHLVAEALRSRLRFAAVFLRDGYQPPFALPDDADHFLLPADIFASAVATEQPQGIAALIHAPDFSRDAIFRAPAPLILVLAGLQDPGNVGTLLRSAEAFAASGVLLLPGTASPWNPKALRASAGSAFRVAAIAASEAEALDLLARHNIPAIAAVARAGTPVSEAPLANACALLIGNEGAGLSDSLLALAAHRITIPMPGHVESLNAAIAGSLLLYEASRQRRKPRPTSLMSLFGGTPELAPASTRRAAPLAERMRPRTLDEYLGQQHLVAPGKPLRMQIETDDPASMIFWGPPGVGKTTLAKIIAETTNATFIEFSAVLSGIKEIKQVMVDAEKASQYGSRTILFVDEIHRFNKAQQDAFLPYVERGTIRLIGATTENPSFEIIAALLSRCRVYTLQPLTEDDLVTLLHRALNRRARPRQRPPCRR